METMSDNGLDSEDGGCIGHTVHSNGIGIGGEQLTHSQQIAAVCSDTSRKLDCLTAELQNSDKSTTTRRPGDGGDKHEDCERKIMHSNQNTSNGRTRGNADNDVVQMMLSATATTNTAVNCDTVDGPQSFASVVQNGQQLSAIMQGGYLNNGKHCAGRSTTRSSISPTRFDIAVEPPLAATDHNQILSSVDANCSKTLYPSTASQHQQPQYNGNTHTKQHLANGNNEPLVETNLAASAANPSQPQLPCDNCAVAVDVLPADILYNNSNHISQAQPQHSHNAPNANANTHGRHNATGTSLPHQANSMDESIMIQPEFQRMDITNGGGQAIGNGTSRRDFHAAGRTYSMPTTSNSSGGLSTATTPATYTAAASSSSNGSVSPPPIAHPSAGGGGHHAHHSHSTHHHNAGTSRFSTPGMRSLPLTPPASHVHERPTVAISCPDGLAHALSEQNLRLQQIVQEHRVGGNTNRRTQKNVAVV